jgi:cell division protease FtsH
VIDAEVRRIVDEGYRSAHKIINGNMDQLHAIAKALLEYETLSGDDINTLLKGEPIVRPHYDDPPSDSGKRASVPESGGKGAPGDLEPEPQPGS